MAVALLCCTAASAAPGLASAQPTFAVPQLGWSELRRFVVGAQVGRTIFGSLDVSAEGLVFFPAEETDREDVSLDRGAWQANLNLSYAFNPDRRLVPYLGVGASFARSSRTVVLDQVRARVVVDGWTPNLIVGLRVPQLPWSPFVEWRREIRRERQWMTNAGLRIPL